MKQTSHEDKRLLLEHIFDINEFKHSIERAFELIIERITPELKKKESEDFQKNFLSKISRLNADMIDKLKDQKGKSIQQLLEISDKSMDKLNKLGIDLVGEENPEDASAVFTLCAYLNPTKPVFWTGLLISLYDIKNFKRAEQVSEFLKLIQPNKAIGYIYSAIIKYKQNPKANVSEDLDAISHIFQESKDEKGMWSDFASDSLKIN